MAVLASARMANIKASVEKYIYDKVVLIEGIAVDFEEVPFESGDHTEWIQERLMGVSDFDFHRQVGGGADLGQTKELLLSFNCFVQRDNTTKVVRHYELRDLIYNYFTIGKTIPIYDYNDDDFVNVLDYLKVFEIDTDAPLPNNDWRQYNLTLVLQYTERWTKT